MSVWLVIVVDIHAINKKNMSWKIVYVVKKVRLLFSKHSQQDCLVDSVEGGTGRKIVVCCIVKLLMLLLLRTMCE